MTANQHLERGRDGRNQFWRYLVMTLVAFVGGQLLGSIPMLALMPREELERAAGGFDPQALNTAVASGLSRNTSLLLMLLPFAVSLVLLIAMLRPLHGRSLPEIINGRKRIRWGRVLFAAGVWAAIQLAYLGISLALDPDNYIFHFDLRSFLPLLAISLLLIPVQTSFEEIFFRGYLAQGIGAGTRSRWAAILVPGIAFGLMHILNPEIKAYGLILMLSQYILFGLVFGLIATLDDGIECAMGAHAANNIFASAVVTFRSSALATDALLEVRRVDTRWDLTAFLVAATILVAVLWKRYRWTAAVLRTPVGGRPN